MAQNGDWNALTWLLDPPSSLAESFRYQDLYLGNNQVDGEDAMTGNYRRQNALMTSVLRNPKVIQLNSHLHCIMYFHEEKGFYLTEELMIRACENGDLRSIKYLAENGIPVKDNSDPILETALVLGHFDIAAFLLERGCHCYGMVERAASSGNLTLLKYLIDTMGFDYEHDAIMVQALMSPNEVVWEYCLTELGGELTAQCFISPLHDGVLERYEKARRWLFSKGCPFDVNKVVGWAMEQVDLKVLKLITAVEFVALSDAQVSELISRTFALYDVLRWVLLKHRRDYKISHSDVREVFVRILAKNWHRFMAIFFEHGYVWSVKDLSWALQKVDADSEQAFEGSLPHQMVVQCGPAKCKAALEEALASIADTQRRWALTKAIERCGLLQSPTLVDGHT